MIDKYNYDLLLMDILIPEMSGKQLYQWLQENHPKLVNKVVFCTGLAMVGSIKSFLDQTSRPVLRKPFSVDELLNAVHSALRRKK